MNCDEKLLTHVLEELSKQLTFISRYLQSETDPVKRVIVENMRYEVQVNMKEVERQIELRASLSV